VRTEVKELPYHDKSIAAIYNNVLRILYEHHCTMEWALLRIRRGLETLDASLIHLYPDCNYSEVAETYGRQAMLRQADADGARAPAMAAGAVFGTFEIGARVGEYAMFQAGIIRRQVRAFHATSNKALDLVSTAVGQLALLGVVGSGLSVAIWLAQRHSGWVMFLGGGRVARLAGLVPVLDWQLWVLVLFGTLYTSNALVRLRRRLRRHERRAAERVATV
jgi:hypothetical protein